MLHHVNITNTEKGRHQTPVNQHFSIVFSLKIFDVNCHFVLNWIQKIEWCRITATARRRWIRSTLASKCSTSNNVSKLSALHFMCFNMIFIWHRQQHGNIGSFVEGIVGHWYFGYAQSIPSSWLFIWFYKYHSHWNTLHIWSSYSRKFASL